MDQLAEYLDLFCQPKMRIINYVKNGKSTIYYDQYSKTYWRTLKAAKNLGPSRQQIKKPRHVTR